MLRRLRAGIRPVDGWLALGFVVAAAIEAVIRHGREPVALVNSLAGAATFACLALRRTRPLLIVSIMTVVFAVGSIAAALLAPHTSGDAAVPIFALLVISYSLGAFGSRRQLLGGAWQPVLVVLIVDLAGPSGYSLISGTLFIAVFISAAPILAGRLVRGRNRLVRRLREQAGQIDDQRGMQVEAAVAGERLRMTQRFHVSLISGIQSLAAQAADLEASGTAGGIAEIERAARDLLSQTREEVVGLTAPTTDAEAPPDAPQPSASGTAAQPWTVLAGAALCAGLLIETRTLPLHVPLAVAWLACVVLAVPLAVAWLRPVPAIVALWLLAALFGTFVASLDGSFTAIGLSFVPPFLVAALVPRRRAVIGLAVCLVGEFVCFGPNAFVGNGAVVACCWVAGAVFYERTRLVEQLRANNAVLDDQRTASARHAVAAERLRVARELHDAVGHSLTVIALQAGAARRIAESDPARTQAVLRTIATVARDGLCELQRGAVAASDDDDPRTLDGLLATARAAGLQIEAQVEDVADMLSPDTHFAVFRVVQESLTNILKHAPGAPSALSIHANGGHVEVLVSNGAPTAPVAAAAGDQHGLRGMTARVEACGGQLRWARRPDGGFEVRARLPVALVAS